MKLSALLQKSGWGSRKECTRLVRAGRVSVESEKCLDPNRDVDENTLPRIAVNEHEECYRKSLYILLNKPVGFECSHNPQAHESVFVFFPLHWSRRGLQTAGRLDVNTSGLILLSDDGDFLHRVVSPAHGPHRRYLAQTVHPLDKRQLECLSNGVRLKNDKKSVRALEVLLRGEKKVELLLDRGKYHQVRRMMGAVGNRLEKLQRIGIGSLGLEGAPPEGQWRFLHDNEISVLQNRQSEC